MAEIVAEKRQKFSKNNEQIGRVYPVFFGEAKENNPLNREKYSLPTRREQ